MSQNLVCVAVVIQPVVYSCITNVIVICLWRIRSVLNLICHHRYWNFILCFFVNLKYMFWDLPVVFYITICCHWNENSECYVSFGVIHVALFIYGFVNHLYFIFVVNFCVVLVDNVFHLSIERVSDFSFIVISSFFDNNVPSLISDVSQWYIYLPFVFRFSYVSPFFNSYISSYVDNSCFCRSNFFRSV